LVDVLVVVTVTPGKTAPDWSLMVPWTSAAVSRDCANKTKGIARKKNMMRRTRTRDAIGASRS